MSKRLDKIIKLGDLVIVGKISINFEINPLSADQLGGFIFLQHTEFWPEKRDSISSVRSIMSYIVK